MAKGGSAQNKAIHASGAAGANTMREQFLTAHVREIGKKKADALNIGHNVTDNSIGSKTDKGYLTTKIDKKGTITHKWDE